VDRILVLAYMAKVIVSFQPRQRDLVVVIEMEI